MSFAASSVGDAVLFLVKRMQRFLQHSSKQILIFLLLLVAWFIVCEARLWSTYILPTPAMVAETMLAMFASGELAEAVLVSFRRVFLGFSSAFVLAFLLGIVGVMLPGLRPYYMSFVDFVRHVPPLSLIPLLILWAGIGETPKVIVILLATFGPMLLNIDAGLGGCDKKLIEVGRILGFTKQQLFWRIMLPSAWPHIFVGMRVGLGYSLRAIIGAEMVAASSGLGYMILDAQTMSRTDKAIVGIIAIGVLGLCLDFVLGKLMHKLFPYLPSED